VKKFWSREPEPVPQPAVEVSREQELLNALHRIDASREEIGESIRAFQKRNTVVIDGVQKYMAGTICARPELDRLWADLLRADSQLLDARNRILKDLAKIRCPQYVALKTGARLGCTQRLRGDGDRE
jgi:hypothetical protein